MSVFGGDSWGSEARYRKRRVDDLMLDGIDASSYKKLSNGKFTCLVCPHNPILDTPLMLSMHIKGLCYRASESKFKEKELLRRHEINKRIALSDCSVDRLTKKPLIEQTCNSVSDVLCETSHLHSSPKETRNVNSSRGHIANETSTTVGKVFPVVAEAAYKEVVRQGSDLRERREKELKYISAGWKRDHSGRWFKDEDAEFDSDEDDPNICL